MRDEGENAVAPGRLEVTSADGNVSLPLSVYPQEIAFNGTGSVTAAASYSCQ
jgi:hypothetical protein